MGSCFSYCRRPTPGTDDREPLLPRQLASTDRLPTPTSHVDKLAEALAALRVGKLPSQDQVNAALRKVLRSDVLAVEGSKSARILGQGQHYGPLSERGKSIIRDVREVVEAIIQFGMEKNDDDRIQDLIYQNSRMGTVPVAVDVDVATNREITDEMEDLASAVPSTDELKDDAHHMSHSLLTLSRLLLTSSTFRLLLSDILLTSRALLADVAANVGKVARNVELKAETVEETLRPDETQDSSQVDTEELGRHTKAEIGDVAEKTKTEWEKISEESPDRIKEVVLKRIQKTISHAQKTPAYNSAFKTLLSLLRKYADRGSTAAAAMSSLSSSATVTPILTTDPHLAQALTDLRIILERLASRRPLSILISHAESILRDLIYKSSPSFKSELRQYFDDVGEWLDKGLRDPSFATSTQGHKAAERLYDRGYEVMHSEENEPWAENARNFLDEADYFAHALASDKTTRRIADSLEKLSAHSAEFGQAAVGASMHAQKARREELKRDILGWVVPRALRMFKTVPMPRVEVKSGRLEFVIDSLLLQAASGSFVPDHAILQNWSEIRLEASAAVLDANGAPLENDLSGGGITTSTRTRVHIDGLRISAHGVGYYVKYIGPLGGLITWEDNGLASLDVGAHNALGQGLTVDIEVETTPAENDESPVFVVNDVQVDIPGLGLVIDNSRHWIFNKLLVQPLAGPVGRRVLRSVVASQIRAGLESLNERMMAVRIRAKERVRPVQDQEPSLEDYWEALLETSAAEQEQEEPAPLVETDTHLTLKGVVRSTVTQQKREASTPPTPSETVVAVGVGAQILPGKGGPQPEVRPVAEQAREALTDVENAGSNAVGKAKDLGGEVMETAVRTRGELEDAAERMDARESVERRKKGWRSRAFDF